MTLIKKLVKKLLSLYYRIKTVSHKKTEIFHHDYKENLNSYYPEKEYNLSEAISNIDEYEYDLSIIVPVYNAGKYLSKCIDSLIKQKTEYKYEVICVDDGSSDNSLEILNSYEGIKVIHQENGGISSARNTGLMNSRGRYVGFVDNDDVVNENYVEKILSYAIENNLDYVKCSFAIFRNDDEIVDVKKYKDAILSDMNNIDDYDNWLDGYMWGGCYARDLWDRFCFPAGYWYEDMIRNIYLFDMCERIGSISDVLYYKRIHENNAADVLWKKDNEKCLDQLYLIKQLLKLKKDRNTVSNNLSKCASLIEMGEYLYKRTMNLDEKIRVDAFLNACDLIDEYDIRSFDMKNDFVLNNISKAFKDRDFGLYNLVGKYCRYN